MVTHQGRGRPGLFCSMGWGPTLLLPPFGFTLHTVLEAMGQLTDSLKGEEEFSRVQEAFFFYNHSSCQPPLSPHMVITPSSPCHFLLPWRDVGWGGGTMSQENGHLYFSSNEQRTKDKVSSLGSAFSQRTSLPISVKCYSISWGLLSLKKKK